MREERRCAQYRACRAARRNWTELDTRVLDGSGMVVGQAAAAFGIFTGRKADKARMRASFTQA